MSAFLEHEGVLASPTARKQFGQFEALYRKLRAAEGRAFSDDDLRRLPAVPANHPHAREWRIREVTIKGFLRRLDANAKNQSILDVGCGNGFFSALLAQRGHSVTGVDVNLDELVQAARVFGKKNLAWYCADLMNEELAGSPFDLVVFNASFHYFAAPGKVLKRCLELVRPGGSIHILETPFYRDARHAESGRAGAARHFQRMGAPEISAHFHHHTWDQLNGFETRIRRSPAGRLRRWMDRSASPFAWVEVFGAKPA